MKKQLLSTLFILALCMNAFAQDLVYTVSGKFDQQPIPLDSILVENLTNNSRLLFDDLPAADQYLINLSLQTVESATGIQATAQRSPEFVVTRNQPGFMVLTHHGKSGVDVRVSVINANGQEVYLSSNKPLSSFGRLEVQLGQPGVYLVKVESSEGVQSFKATGALNGQSINVLYRDGGTRPSEL